MYMMFIAAKRSYATYTNRYPTFENQIVMKVKFKHLGIFYVDTTDQHRPQRLDL